MAEKEVVPPCQPCRRPWGGARRRLEGPGCRGLFAELRDGSGRGLQEGLEALGQTPSTYLSLVLFADASHRPHCKAGGVFAFTAPKSRVIFVCNAQIAEAAGRNLGLVEAVLIHEELHSLGLGENTPTSEEITTRVMAACPRQGQPGCRAGVVPRTRQACFSG